MDSELNRLPCNGVLTLKTKSIGHGAFLLKRVVMVTGRRAEFSTMS